MRHNLSLLSSTTFASLSSLAREGKSVEERRLYLDHEEGRIRKAVESQEHSINRLESIKKIVEKITEIERETMELLLVVESSGGELDPEMFLKPFVDEFDELYGNYSKEYEEMRLDEVVVGAIAPIVGCISFVVLDLMLTVLSFFRSVDYYQIGILLLHLHM